MPTGSFVPTNNSEWKEVTVPLGIYSNFLEDIMFKWEFTSGGGNNFYLDDINLDVVVGQDEWNTPSEISVYPNPVFRGGIVIFEAPLELGQKVKLLSITGQVVAEFENLNNQTTQELQIPASLSPGVYFLVTGSGISKKLIVR
jgi:hypothetical protein